MYIFQVRQRKDKGIVKKNTVHTVTLSLWTMEPNICDKHTIVKGIKRL